MESNSQSSTSSTTLDSHHTSGPCKQHHDAIREVWSHNLVEELANLDAALKDGNSYLSFDTEFAGFVPQEPNDTVYGQVYRNVNTMKLLQLGITVASQGRQIRGTWQFNFSFDAEADNHEQEAIQMLTEAGINFARLANEGIDSRIFARHFSMMGLTSNPQLTWLAFNSKYDFAYLLSLFTPLPVAVSDFLEQIAQFCPNKFDVKHLGQGCLKHQLEEEGIATCGQHQAGFDSLVTMQLFQTKYTRRQTEEQFGKIHKLDCLCFGNPTWVRADGQANKQELKSQIESLKNLLKNITQKQKRHRQQPIADQGMELLKTSSECFYPCQQYPMTPRPLQDNLMMPAPVYSQPDGGFYDRFATGQYGGTGSYYAKGLIANPMYSNANYHNQ